MVKTTILCSLSTYYLTISSVQTKVACFLCVWTHNIYPNDFLGSDLIFVCSLYLWYWKQLNSCIKYFEIVFFQHLSLYLIFKYVTSNMHFHAFSIRLTLNHLQTSEIPNKKTFHENSTYISQHIILAKITETKI